MVIEQTGKKQQNRKINPFDGALIVIILLCGAGFFLAKSGHAGVNKAIDENGSVVIDVAFTGVKTLDTGLFKVGAPASITVRNVPIQPPMKILRVTETSKQVSFLSPDGKKAIAMADPANPIAHDFLVTVQEDNANNTNDGWVIHGNKIKVGNQIELEAAKYRVQGVIADVNSLAQFRSNESSAKPGAAASAGGSSPASTSSPKSTQPKSSK